MRERVLIIEGRASSSVLFHVQGALPQERPANCEVLLLSFAYADIPIGRSFTMGYLTSAPHAVTRTRFTITGVTQQFAVPFDEVSHGWKTICLVEFPEGIPDLIASLPLVNGWYENPNTVSICDEDTWKLRAG